MNARAQHVETPRAATRPTISPRMKTRSRKKMNLYSKGVRSKTSDLGEETMVSNLRLGAAVAVKKGIMTVVDMRNAKRGVMIPDMAAGRILATRLALPPQAIHGEESMSSTISGARLTPVLPRVGISPPAAAGVIAIKVANTAGNPNSLPRIASLWTSASCGATT